MVDLPRVGLGFDVHPLAPGRQLWLGGVRFDDAAGLAGHSDGDVVCHAIADAILGAAGLGDLGDHFPDGVPATAGIAGAELLEAVRGIAAAAGRALSSVDATVVCDHPPIAPRREEMRARLAGVLGLPPDRVSLKATRPEGLGLRGDGIGCLAVAVLS